MVEEEALPLPLPSYEPAVPEGREWDASTPQELIALDESVTALLSDRDADGAWRSLTNEDVMRANYAMVDGVDVIRNGLADPRQAMGVLELVRDLANVSFHGGVDDNTVENAHNISTYLLTVSLDSLHEAVSQSDDPLLLAKAIEYVTDSLDSGYEEGVSERVNFLNETLEAAVRQDVFSHEEVRSSPASIVRRMAAKATVEQQQQVVDTVGRLVTDTDPDVVLRGAELLDGAMTGAELDGDVRRHLIEDTVQGMLEKHGINYEQAAKIWSKAAGFLPGMYEAKNVRMIAELEHERPGICKVLSDKQHYGEGHYGFGVINFARYPKEMLIAQYDQRDDATLDYGVLATSAADGSGTMWLYRGGIAELYTSGNTQEPKVAVRAYEVDKGTDLYVDWRQAARKYGPMSYRVIIGHGRKGGIFLDDPGEHTEAELDVLLASDDSPEGMLTKQDIDKLSNTDFLTDISEPGCETVVVSCITGADDGIVEHASKTFPNEPFTAPSLEAALDSLRVDRDEHGTVGVHVAYGMARGGEKRRFLGGAIVAAELV